MKLTKGQLAKRKKRRWMMKTVRQQWKWEVRNALV